MKLSASELEAQLRPFGYHPAKVQRVDDALALVGSPRLLEKPGAQQAVGVVGTVAGLGALFGSLFLAGTSSGPIFAVVVAIAGYAAVSVSAPHAFKARDGFHNLTPDQKRARRLEPILDMQREIDVRTAAANEIVREALRDSFENDGNLVRAFKNGHLEMDMPGMVEAMHQRIQARMTGAPDSSVPPSGRHAVLGDIKVWDGSKTKAAETLVTQEVERLAPFRAKAAKFDPKG